MALAIGALFFALRKDAQVRKARDETRKAQMITEIHVQTAKKVREEKSKLEDEIGDWKLRAKSAKDIATALDEAKLPAGSDGLKKTLVLKMGELFKNPGPESVLIVDPKRAASSANALRNAEAKAVLLASCQTDRDTYLGERNTARTDLVKAKARFSKGILIGAGGTVVTFIAVSLLTKKKSSE